MEALLRPTESAQLRRQVLFFIPVPIPVVALVALVVDGRVSAPGWMILLSGSVAVASLLLAVIVQPSPLPEGLSAQASVRRSLHRFQQITTLRISLALTPVVVGAGTAVAGGGLFPLLVALALAWPQLVLAMPTFFTITRARRAMEAWGTRAYLWAGLAQPARVRWPVVTLLMDQYRRYRERRAWASEEEPHTVGHVVDAACETDDGEPATSGSGEDADASERAAGSTGQAKADPTTVVPGIVASPARRILRTGDGIRRRVRGGRGDRRPRAKS
ncbi:hypothetical protein EFW17_09290 [Halostreptopolyspora alba]|uniref:Uncharacterized protein n=2 Tax=Halostreptopolyspora alba TaxID=2487137 RepID=A0A3N0EBX9_9ACTN|nr:hypothetical protein EFW17_09290 [Nocardiopsaceae bacterium YIM 96095]